MILCIKFIFGTIAIIRNKMLRIKTDDINVRL